MQVQLRPQVDVATHTPAIGRWFPLSAKAGKHNVEVIKPMFPQSGVGQPDTRIRELEIQVRALTRAVSAWRQGVIAAFN